MECNVECNFWVTNCFIQAEIKCYYKVLPASRQQFSLNGCKISKLVLVHSIRHFEEIFNNKKLIL